MPLDVPRREKSALAMSGLVLVDHAEAVPAEQKDPTNPLYFGTTLIYPNLGTPVTRSKRGSLVFFYTARGGGASADRPGRAAAGRRVLAAKALAVPPADDTGLVQHANELPLDGDRRRALRAARDAVRRGTTVTRAASFVIGN